MATLNGAGRLQKRFSSKRFWLFHTFVKFSGAPVSLIECNNPWKSSKGSMPFFTYDSKVLYSANDIMSYLRQQNYNCDFGLSPKQAAEVIAYGQFVTEALQPTLQYLCWVLDSNYVSTTRPCYGSRLPWFYKLWYPDRRLKHEADELIKTKYPDSGLRSDAAEPYILYKAQQCVQLLSDKLGSNEFFLFPNSPCTLDSIIFAYLAPFLKIPLPHCPVKEYIRATPNLERYVARITHRYFSSVQSSGDSFNVAHSSGIGFGKDGRPREKSSDEPTYPRRHKFLAFLIATAAMLTFAYRNGMVRIERVRAIEEETEDDDERLIWE